MADPFDTPGYRFAVNNFPGDGSTTDWNIDFAGRTPGYISIDHVRAALIDDTTGEETPVLLGPENFILPTRIRVTPAVPEGVTLRVWRDTPKDMPMLDYTDGALMIERNLDTSNEQNIYAIAEMVDRFADSLDDVTAFTMEVLTRLGQVENTANEAHDTANTALATSNQAMGIAGQALNRANEAVDAVAGAEQAAIEATQAAQNANAAATTATTAANQANQAAQDATDAANQAEATAADALSVAQGIAGTAQEALDTANAAVTTAQGAVDTANGIDGKAQLALDTAGQAEQTAQNAVDTANGIDAKAQSALDTANQTSTDLSAVATRVALLEDRTLPIALPSGVNLDNYLTAGVYYQNFSTAAAAGTNYPVALAGILVVRSGTANGVGGTSFVYQHYTTYVADATAAKYYRNRYKSTWGPWQKVASNTDLDALDTQLRQDFGSMLNGYIPQSFVGIAEGIPQLDANSIVKEDHARLPTKYRTGGALSVSTYNITVQPGVWRSNADTHNIRLTTAITKVLQASGGWAAGGGNNGLLSGSRQASTWYHVYVIYNPITKVTDVAMSTSLPPSGMPAGFTQWRRVGSVLTNPSQVLIPFLQAGRHFTWYAIMQSHSNATMTNASTILTYAPPGVRTRVVNTIACLDVGPGRGIALYPPNIGGEMNAWFQDYVRSNEYHQASVVETVTDLQSRVQIFTSPASLPSVYIGTKGYEDFLED